MAIDSVQETHRPGLFKQQNKSHKHGKHRSKGALEIAAKGRTSVKTFTKKARRDLQRNERRNRTAQIRQNKRDEVLFKKRSLGGSGTAPFLVAIIPLCDDIDPSGALEFLKQADEEAVITNSQAGNVHISVPRFKQRFSTVIPRCGDLYCALDALKVADTALFLVSASHGTGIDDFGENLLTVAFAQGLPSTVVAVLDLESLPPKKRHEGKQLLQKTVSRWLPDEKVSSLSNVTDALTVLRRIGNQKQRSVNHRDKRPYMLAETKEYIPDSEGNVGTLKVSGYVRGQPFNVNSLVHIPGWGDFQMSQIDAPDDPHILDLGRKGKSKDESTASSMDEERILEKADPAKQESLQSENIPDPMDAEQTWPTAEELAEAEEEAKAKKRKVKRIPKGMSEYQAAWIPDSDAEEEDITDDEDDMNEMDLEAASEEKSSDEEEDDAEEYETITMTDTVNDVRYDEKMDLAEEEDAMEKIKEARMDQLFPDELDTPKDVAARVRFQKYRGLQSFRTSPWDPKENLPHDYARIFQFENFERTRKRLLKDDDREGALPGWYVTLHIRGVPQHLYNSRHPDHPIVIVGMLPHEQKMSVLNFAIKQPNVSNNQQPIKSKEQLIFHCGYRRFKACPIFSQHTNGTKHKYERFFQPEATVVASVFAPIMFPPSPVLVFKEMKDNSHELVAVGNLLSVNPDRIVAKRVVLSGHPYKVHKRSSVIRFMFFNPEDIKWFKPVELRTKHGRRGHIKESLGTHGHMKCVFDGQLKSQDTVLMNLYKRVFPKWTYEPYVNSPPTFYGHSADDCAEPMI